MKLSIIITAMLILMATIALPTMGYSQRSLSAEERRELETGNWKRMCMTSRNDATEAEPWCHCISVEYGIESSVDRNGAVDRVRATCGYLPAIPAQNKYVRKGACVTLDGKEFEWRHANVPWNTLSCS